MGGQLDGRVAAVTGGGTGLGEAIARRFAAEGALVVVSGRRREPIDAVAADIGGMAVVTDVADEASVAALFAKTEQSHGRLDILVNNAGHGGGGLMPVENMDIDEWDRTFAVNVRGVVLCSKYAIPLIKRGGGGAIVHIASVAGIGPLKNQSVYGVSKAAVIALTKPMAHEVGRDGIRVNALCPGAVVTDLYRGNAAARQAATGGTVEDDMARIAGGVALGRLTTREEVASSTLFLATAASGSMTGNILVLDAGKP